MSKETFTDKIDEPKEEEVFEALSAVKPLWDELRTFIEDKYKINGELNFYDNFGWVLRYHKSGRVLISAYPGDGEFNVQIILNAKELKKALKLDLGQDALNLIDKTEPKRGCKWIYLKVMPETELTDIKKLISVR